MCLECSRLLNNALDAVEQQIKAIERFRDPDGSMKQEHWDECQKYRLAAIHAWHIRKIHFLEHFAGKKCEMPRQNEAKVNAERQDHDHEALQIAAL